MSCHVMPPAAGPDFLCLGMIKTGTGWLFDQLQFHPDFWMPPLKELHYLDRDDAGRGRNASSMLEMAREVPAQAEKPAVWVMKKIQAARRPWDERDHQFLAEMADHTGLPLDLARYSSLFRFKGALKSGDVTPHYGALRSDLVRKVAQHLPHTKAILIVRDPVERAWSAISMQDRFRPFEDEFLLDPAKLRTYLQDSKRLKLQSYPSRIVRRWSRHAPNMEMRHFFFDDIQENADEARRDILTFLGADPAKASGDLDAEHNRKASATKLSLAEDMQAVLIDHFREELRACAQLFGGPAKKWAAQYGV